MFFGLSCACLGWGSFTRREACGFFVCTHLYCATCCTVSVKMILISVINLLTAAMLWLLPSKQAQARQKANHQTSVGSYWEERAQHSLFQRKFVLPMAAKRGHWGMKQILKPLLSGSVQGYRIPRTFLNNPRKRGIRGYAVKFDHPSPNFWSVWVSGYADTQWSSTTPPPEFLRLAILHSRSHDPWKAEKLIWRNWCDVFSRTKNTLFNR